MNASLKSRMWENYTYGSVRAANIYFERSKFMASTRQFLCKIIPIRAIALRMQIVDARIVTKETHMLSKDQ